MVKKTEGRKDDGKIIQGLKLCLRKGNRGFVISVICLVGFFAYITLNDFTIKIGDFEYSSKSTIKDIRK